MIVRLTNFGKSIELGANMAWVRTVVWTSKLSHAECMKHFKKEVVPIFKDSPATSMTQVQTGPNSGIFILEFEEDNPVFSSAGPSLGNGNTYPTVYDTGTTYFAGLKFNW